MSSSSGSVVRLVRDAGPGRPLVLFLPGLSGNTAQWTPVEDRLTTHDISLCLGAPILPSSAFAGRIPTVLELATKLLDQIRHERRPSYIVVVAHSVGAFVALAFAQQAGPLVKKVIIVNGGLATVGRFLDRPAREMARNPRTCLTALRLFLLAGTPAPEGVRRSIASNERLSRLLFGGLITKETLGSNSQREAIVKAGGSQEILRALYVNRHHWPQFEGYARTIDVPVEFLVGDQDPMSSERDTRAMAALLPHGKVSVLEGVGHVSPVETAVPLSELIETALQG